MTDERFGTYRYMVDTWRITSEDANATAMQVAARGNGERSSVAATEAEAVAKSYVNESGAKIVANAVYPVSRSKQAAC